MVPANKPTAAQEQNLEDDGLNIEQIVPMFRPEKREEGARLVAMMVEQSHSGPLPAPDTFGHYEAIHPGAAGRILEMAEREQAHRHKMDSRVVTHEFGTRYSGQIAALLSLISLCSVVIYCAYIGQPVASAVIAAIGAVVVGFLKHTQMKIENPTPTPAEPNKQKRATARRKK